MAGARAVQAKRAAHFGLAPEILNATLSGAALDEAARLDEAGTALLSKAALSLRLSARAYHRTLKVARTIADLAGCAGVARIHVAEALSMRRTPAVMAPA